MKKSTRLSSSKTRKSRVDFLTSSGTLQFGHRATSYNCTPKSNYTCIEKTTNVVLTVMVRTTFFYVLDNG